jgi:hypothetical protein
MFGRHRGKGTAVDITGWEIMPIGVHQFHDRVAVFWHVGDSGGDGLGDTLWLLRVAVCVAEVSSMAPRSSMWVKV